MTAPLKLAPWTIRGGAERHGEEILETYVAAMEQKDASSSDASSSAVKDKDSSPDSNSTPQSSSTEDDSAVLGIKAHKKSNAVGDPDSDSDDDSDDTEEEWQELEDFLEEPHQVQVQVELVPDTTHKVSGGGGGSGGGVKKSMGRAAAARFPKHTVKTACTLEAWRPHIYMPPPPSNENLEKLLQQQAKTVDAFGKTRLDRRTLYAGLLLEWHNRGDRRKFINMEISQQLQAALSLATQPQWRQAAPQSSGISLQQGGTLSMQETIAMALVRNQKRK
jgi:hypothetical protein